MSGEAEKIFDEHLKIKINMLARASRIYLKKIDLFVLIKGSIMIPSRSIV